MFTHAKLYARAQQIPAQPPQKIVWTGKASWYSRRSPGINKRTANNEIFNDKDYTAAMWGVPFNQMVRVTNLDNGKSVIVRINDRGPHKRFVRKGRTIDLSKQAFSEIASPKKGLINIQLDLL
jgi:rare lipoprotein A